MKRTLNTRMRNRPTNATDSVSLVREWLYNRRSELAAANGTVLDGITNRTDTTYEQHSNEWWKVEAAAVIGPHTNSLTITKTQLTGLSDSCRRHEVMMVGRDDPIAPPVGASVPLARTETTASFDPSTGIETETTTSSIAPTVMRRSLHGVLLSEETGETTTYTSYDALGRVAATSRTGILPVPDGGTGTTGVSPVATFDYAPCGDLIAKHTYTNGMDIITESYSYDMLGNRIATTDALGNTICRTYDLLGNVIDEYGATYPVRYTYDTAGRRTSLSSTRDGVTWDTTTWTYDPRTSLCTSKTYADGSTVTYTYTPDNLPLRTTYASGRWKENVYDERRRLCGMIYSSSNMDYELQLDEYGRTTFASNGVAQTGYALNDAGGATNETWATDNAIDTITRTFDGAERLTGLAITEQGYAQYLDYSTNGLLTSISNSDAVVAYNYSPDLKDVGYTMAFADGGTFASVAVRDPYRRDLVLSVTNSCGGNPHTLEYSYDALSRPVSRNADTFGYNARSEVSSANIGGNSETYEYDGIGNATFATFNFATNIYTANNLNQYTSILCYAATLRETTHDVDGNLTFDGVFTYAYDADNRLASVSSNGLVLVTNQYDHKGRRVRKTTPTSETTFLYDGWNLIYEREIAGTVTNETFYYWGKDLSGSLQGVGGVGGLLYLKRNGTIYVPHRDANGNIVRYADTIGNVVAEYTYGAFGNTLFATGALADVFNFRYSTKYYDPETGLYYYGYRFYSPVLMRWLNRDPIGEQGGENLYVFCANNPCSYFDPYGEKISIREEEMIVKDVISTRKRGVFLWHVPTPSIVCSYMGTMSISGSAYRKIEILTPGLKQWAKRGKEYDRKWGAERSDTDEWKITYAHEKDHWNSFNKLFAFLHMLNEFDDMELCNKCNQMKEDLERQFNVLYLEAVQKSASYDMPGRNMGGEYPK